LVTSHENNGEPGILLPSGTRHSLSDVHPGKLASRTRFVQRLGRGDDREFVRDAENEFPYLSLSKMALLFNQSLQFSAFASLSLRSPHRSLARIVPPLY
jgi:hypothetical protein